MTPTTRKLQDFYVELWEPHNLPSLSERTYVALFLNEYNRKSWILLLQSKDKFFDTFKLWLSYAKETIGEKLRCL